MPPKCDKAYYAPLTSRLLLQFSGSRSVGAEAGGGPTTELNPLLQTPAPGGVSEFHFAWLSYLTWCLNILLLVRVTTCLNIRCRWRSSRQHTLLLWPWQIGCRTAGHPHQPQKDEPFCYPRKAHACRRRSGSMSPVTQEGCKDLCWGEHARAHSTDRSFAIQFSANLMTHACRSSCQQEQMRKIIMASTRPSLPSVSICSYSVVSLQSSA